MAGLGDGGKTFLPELVSPREGAVYASFGKDPSIPLRAEGTEGVLYWYVDGEYLGEGESPFATFPPGEHRVSLVDGRGLGARASFTVAERPGEGPVAPALSFE